MEHEVVSSKEVGTNCWSAARFCPATRCTRVMRCKYPEKATCKAVYAELEYLRERKAILRADIEAKIRKLDELHQVGRS